MSDFDARAREIACDWHDCPKGLYAKHSLGCDELASAISSALKEAVEGEREACAKACEEIAESWLGDTAEVLQGAALYIRSRKETPDV